MSITLSDSDFLNLDPNQPVVLQIEKIRKIKELKAETSKRIQTINGKYHGDIDWLRKSQNFQDVKADYFISLANGETPTPSEIEAYNIARNTLMRKDAFIVAYNEIKSAVNSLISLEDVAAFDVTDSAKWAGLTI